MFYIAWGVRLLVRGVCMDVFYLYRISEIRTRPGSGIYKILCNTLLARQKYNTYSCRMQHKDWAVVARKPGNGGQT